jgi:hypothetical protein
MSQNGIAVSLTGASDEIRVRLRGNANAVCEELSKPTDFRLASARVSRIERALPTLHV